MTNRTPPAAPLRYDLRSMRLHWLTAALVLLLWCMGETIDWFARGTPRVTARSAHITVGLLLAAILVFRLWWRATEGRRLPPAGDGALARLATWTHALLYLAVVVALLAGVANVWVRGDAFFNLFTVPAFDPGNKALKESVEEVHELAAHFTLIMAALHAAAALLHHYVWKDDVLRRMLPGR
jgi:cytochrome b561